MDEATLEVERARSRRRRGAALVAGLWGAVAAAAACGDKDPQGPELVFQGGYRLEAVNGQNLPILICYPFSPPCDTLKAGQVEVMSRGRIRDILEFGRALRLVSLEVDTAISPYVIDQGRIIVEREQFGGGEVALGGHVDTATIDASGRLLLTRRIFQRQVVPPMTFLYVRE